MNQNNQNKDKLDQVKEGHSYDGIQEYDNPMPRWWVNLFWATVFFSVVYCAIYLPDWGKTSLDEYKADVEGSKQSSQSVVAQASAPPAQASASSTEALHDQLIKAARNPDSIKAGKSIYDSKCMPCHADKGQGLIGPNLTDDTWIHGGQLDQIYHTVSVGVPAKGMIAWEGQLSEQDRINVVAFIRSIQDTNVAGKAPEGEKSAPTPLQ